MITLVRLREVKTDIVVTVSVPHVIRNGEGDETIGNYDDKQVDLEHGKFGRLVEEGITISKEVEAGLDIRDWGLFINDDE